MDVSGLDKRDVPEPGSNMCQCIGRGHGWTGLAQIRIQTLTRVNVIILYCMQYCYYNISLIYLCLFDIVLYLCLFDIVHNNIYTIHYTLIHYKCLSPEPSAPRPRLNYQLGPIINQVQKMGPHPDILGQVFQATG